MSRIDLSDLGKAPITDEAHIFPVYGPSGALLGYMPREVAKQYGIKDDGEGEAYRLLRKRTHILLGVSLALLWMKEQKLNRHRLVWHGEWQDDSDSVMEEREDGEWIEYEDLEKLLSSASVDEIMKTCRVESADGQD